MAEGTDSGGKRLFAAALAVYVALFAVFVAAYILLKDGDSLVAGMSAVAFVFLLVSAVLAYHVFFRTPKDRAPEDVSEEAWEKGRNRGRIGYIVQHTILAAVQCPKNPRNAAEGLQSAQC